MLWKGLYFVGGFTIGISVSVLIFGTTKTVLHWRSNFDDLDDLYDLSKRNLSNTSNLIDYDKNESKNGNDIHDLYIKLLNPNFNLCNDTYIEGNIGGEFEPDTHICLDRLHYPCYAFSFGVAYDFSFDDIMLERGCYVWSFDPSMKPGNYTRHKNHQFLHLGIGDNDGQHIGKSTLWSKNNMNYDVMTLKTLIERYNISYLDIVRMDIESAEWDVLQDWINNDLFKYIGQLLLEIHMFQTEKYKLKDFAKIINSIPMNIFWAQKNLWNKNKLYKDMTQVYELDLIQGNE